MNDTHTIGFPDYRIEVGNAKFALIDPQTGHVLFAAASPLLLRPEYGPLLRRKLMDWGREWVSESAGKP